MLGCAVGDAIGLPYEAITKRRGVRMLGEPDRHRFLFGRGMVSDDTEHTWMVGQALCESPTDPEAFARAFARRLRWWLLSGPAGIGSATLRATIRLWLGYSPSRSGVFSAGNGPAMRSAVLGAAIDDIPSLRRFVLASTRITHTDPKAFEGAFAVALAAWCSRRGIVDVAGFFRQFRDAASDVTSSEFTELLGQVEHGLASQLSVEEFAIQLGCERGVSGYIYRTVPVVLFAWLRHHEDFRRVVGETVRCGGDTDTTAAIAGAIVGSGVGPAGLPQDWVDGLWEWPRTVSWTKQLAEAVVLATASGLPVRPPRVLPLIGLVRNAAFLTVVLAYIFRRLLPPY